MASSVTRTHTGWRSDSFLNDDFLIEHCRTEVRFDSNHLRAFGSETLRRLWITLADHSDRTDDGQQVACGPHFTSLITHRRRSANTGRLTIFCELDYSPIARFSDNKFLIRSARLARIRHSWRFGGSKRRVSNTHTNFFVALEFLAVVGQHKLLISACT